MNQFINVTNSLLEGFGQNCLIFIVTILAAMPLGLIVSMGSMSKFKPIKWITKTFCVDNQRHTSYAPAFCCVLCTTAYDKRRIQFFKNKCGAYSIYY